jgi:hypothetical protein
MFSPLSILVFSTILVVASKLKVLGQGYHTIPQIPALITALAIGMMAVSAAAWLVGGWSFLWGLLISWKGLAIILITSLGIGVWWVLVKFDLAY